MKKIFLKTKNGYTLLETMIAVSLFIVVVMFGMDALLNANLVHQKSQSMRSIMDNLSFVMDDMSRNLRTGYNYQCISDGSVAEVSLGSNPPLSGQNCWGIVFEPAGGNPQWAYEIVTQSGKSFIVKFTDNGATWFQLTPNEVTINASASGFSVLGAEAPTNIQRPFSTPGEDLQQPFATIRLVGSITLENVTTPFSLQTSVSQRSLDI